MARDSDTVPFIAQRTIWLVAAALAILPFLFVAIPPLADAPGHLAQLAIQTAPDDSPLRRYFQARWALKLNLGTDLAVEVLRPLLGLHRAFWLVTAAIPPLTVAAIAALARVANRGRAAAASLSLPFAYSYPFQFGFLNFALGMALALLAYALWLRIAGWPRLREALFWLLVPALLVVHAIGGGLLPVMIVAGALAERRPLAELRPMLGALPVIVAWKLTDHGAGLATIFGLSTKVGAVVLALRDQDRLLDIGSMIAVIAVPIAGRLLGARYSARNLAVVGAIAAIFLALPNELDGAAYTDTRLVPALAIAALTLQDWSGVPRRWSRAVAIAGLAVFAARMAVTTAGFAAYGRSYAAESAALAHVAPGSRVLALVTRQCRAGRQWRMDRLDHLPALAIVERASWTNVMWDVPGLHLLAIRFRPSPDFYDDPSHYVWPEECVRGQDAPRTEQQRRNLRRTIAQAAPLLPLDRVDYLWLVDAALPADFAAGRLTPIWSSGRSTLYRTLIRPAARAPD